MLGPRSLALAVSVALVAACGDDGVGFPMMDAGPDAGPLPDAGPPPSTIATLDDIEISLGTLTPRVGPDVFTYTVAPTVFPEGEVEVRATPTDPDASLSINGERTSPGEPVTVPLGIGVNTINLVVTAPAGSPRRTYTLQVDATSAELADLESLSGPLVPAFDPEVERFLVRLAALTGSVQLVPVSVDPGATITVGEEQVASGAVSDRFRVPRGARRTIEVTCLARDGVTQTRHLVTFNGAEAAQVARLDGDPIQDGDRLGEAVDVDGGRFVVGLPAEDSDGTGRGNDDAPEAGAVRVFELEEGGSESWAEAALLKAPVPASGERFGASVALDGDTLVVGAPGTATDGLAGAGAAHVFVRDDDGLWSHQATLEASNAGADDAFGTAVALAGDQVVVGAPGESSRGIDPATNDAPGAGGAYVFTRDADGVWSETVLLKAGNPDVDAAFGASVATQGGRVAVGAPGESTLDADDPETTAPGSGAVYVFEPRSVDGALVQEAFLKATPTGAIGAGDAFGTAVALFADSVLVGAPGDDANGSDRSNNEAPDAGAVYAFVREVDGEGEVRWVVQGYIKGGSADDGQVLDGDRFGTSVALFDNSAVIGAPGEDGDGFDLSSEGVTDSGAAFVFRRLGDLWSLAGYLKAEDVAADAAFGSAVATDAARFLIGSPGRGTEEPPRTDAGSVYVFD
ncbi:MAG TPA: cadherin-like beta sandwich domain-containing protein [Polyangiaceae bacterium LLY-WYZ-14_1]|nr:cadherin-like beta sandwich domain-containing protein [Polyangiaceae bacterium LLY-WYZ-14_1]